MKEWERFDTALLRCLTEIEIIHAQRIALIELARLRPDSADICSGFLGLSRAAFNFSTQGRLALVLEKSKKKRSGFWWLHDTSNAKGIYIDRPDVEDISYLEDMSEKLSKLRNNTLFHIGEISLKDARKFREDVGITYDEFDKAVSLSRSILWNLLDLRKASSSWTQGGRGLIQMNYDGSDVAQIIRAGLRQ